METRKQRKTQKEKKPLTGIQVVARIFGVRDDTVSRVITGQTKYTEKRVELYKKELELVADHQQHYINKRREVLTNQNELS